jgi:hypothetical protein
MKSGLSILHWRLKQLKNHRVYKTKSLMQESGLGASLGATGHYWK